MSTTHHDFVVKHGLSLADNTKIKLGSSNDLQLYHDGSNSYVEDAGTGLLYLKSDGLGIKIQSAFSGTLYDVIDILAIQTDIKVSGTTRLSATSAGATVTGTLTVNGVVDANSFTDVITNSILTASGNLDIDTVLNSRDVTFTQGSNSLMTIGGTGNVGIGTNSPSTFTNYTNVSIKGGSAGANLDFHNASGARRSALVASDTGLIVETNTTATPIMFKTGATPAERMRIDSSGNVGVGTTSPGSTLDVHGNTNLGSDNIGQQYTTTLSGFSVTANGSDYYGSYGTLILNSNQNYTSTSRPYMITNALGANKFAIISGTNALTDPTIGTGGAVTSGSVRLVIDNAGNVGIGTTSPSEKLDIQGGDFKIGTGFKIISLTSGAIGLNRDPDSGAGYTSGLRRFQINGPFSGSDYLDFQSYNSSGVYQGSLVLQDGNVGIGTTAPSFRLHVLDTIGTRTLSLGHGVSSGTITTDTAKALNFQQAGTTKMTLDNSGNLGIGTTSPTSLLHLSSGSYPKLNLTDTTGVARTFSVGTNSETFTIRNETASADAFTIDNANNAEFHSLLTLPSYILHTGNTGTKFGFGSANTMNFISNGSDRLTIANSYAVFNEAGTDYDFRVESNGNANMIRVDGGNNRVGIGESLPTKTLSVLGDAIIKNTTDGTYLTLHSTQANNASGPDIVLFRDSTSPADDDALSTIFYQGKNSAGSTKDYMKIRTHIADVTNGTEDFGMDIQIMTAGNAVNALDIIPAELIINNAGIDRDFRVESNGNANMLFVDGGNNQVGIGTASMNSYYSKDLVVSAAAEGGITIVGGSSESQYLMFADGTSGTQRYAGYVQYAHSSDTLILATGGNAVFNLSPTESVMNEQGLNRDFRVESDTNANMLFVDGGNNRVGIGTSAPAYTLDVSGAAGDVVRFTGDANNSMRAYLGSGYQIFQCVNSGTTNQFGYGVGSFYVQTSGTERMRIDSSGKFGFGTTVVNRSDFNIHGANRTLASTTSQVAITASDSIAANIGGSLHFGARYDTSTTDFAPTAYIAGRRENATVNNYAGYLQFGVTQGNAGTIEAMRINSSGNVGIGTASPQDKLNIHDSSASANLGLKITRGTQNHGLRLGVNDSHAFLWTSEAQDLAFATNNAQRMTIASAGNVGIGTASPGEKLEVAGNVESEGLKLNVNTSMYTQDASLSYYSSTNAVYLNGAGNNGWLRLNASGTQNDGVAINLFGSNAGNLITLKTNTAERMRITSTGNVGIGLTNPLNKLAVAGAISVEGAAAAGISEGLLIDYSTNLARFLTYDSSTGSEIAFYTQPNGGSTTERMRITSGGNFLVGTTDSTVFNNSTGAGVVLGLDNSIQVARLNDVPLLVNRQGNDGAIASFYKDGTTVGSIGVINNDNLKIGGSVADHAGLQFALHEIVPMEANVDSDGTINLGSVNSKFKDAHFSGTVNSNGLSALNSGSGDCSVQIKSTSAGDPKLIFDSAAANRSGVIQFRDQGANVGRIEYVNNGDRIDMRAGSATGITMSILNGRVGIGTTAPNRDLSVAGVISAQTTANDAAILLLPLASENRIYSRAGDASTTALPLTFRMGDTERMRIDSSGNVGIGTASPGADGNDTPVLDIKQTTSGQKAAAYMRVTAETNAAYKSESFYTGHYRDTGNGEYATVAMIGMESTRTAAINIGGDLNFYTKEHGGANAVAPTQKMVIKHDGKVGIGTTAPSAPLHVVGKVMAGNVLTTHGHANADDLILGDISNSATGMTIVSTGSGSIHFGDGTSSGNANIQGQLVYAHNDNSFRFYTAVTEKMRITSTGNVGIGTSAPGRKLHLKDGQIKFQNTGSGGWAGLDFSMGNGTYDGYMGMLDSNGSFFIDVDSNGNDFVILQNGNVGIGTSAPGAGLEVLKAGGGKIRISETAARYVEIIGYAEGTANGSTMAFQTIQAGTSTSTERMRIDSSGNVGIGTTAPLSETDIVSLQIGSSSIAASQLVLDDNDTNGPWKIRSNQSLQIYDNTSERMRILANGNVGIGNTDAGSALDVTSISNAEGIRIRGRASDGISQLSITSNSGSTYAQIQTHSGETKIKNLASVPLSFHTNNTERMRLDGSGNVGIGTTAPSKLLHISKSADGAKLRLTRGGVSEWDFSIGNSSTLTGVGSGALEILPQNAGTARELAIGSVSAGTPLLHVKPTDGLFVGFGDIQILASSRAIGSARIGLKYQTGYNNFGSIVPYDITNSANNDDTTDLGQSNVRFDDVYATNGTIQTSDQDEKQDFEALSDAEKRVAVAAKGLLKKFRWKSAVVEKGDDARIHFGIVAQELDAAFTAEGLDAGRYGMFISSTWTEDGVQKTRRGVRYHELLAFIISAL